MDQTPLQMFQPTPQDQTGTQREKNASNFEKFYCRFEIDFQINLMVLLLLEHFQRCPPINKILTVYYLIVKKCKYAQDRYEIIDFAGINLLRYSTVPL